MINFQILCNYFLFKLKFQSIIIAYIFRVTEYLNNSKQLHYSVVYIPIWNINLNFWFKWTYCILPSISILVLERNGYIERAIFFVDIAFYVRRMKPNSSQVNQQWYDLSQHSGWNEHLHKSTLWVLKFYVVGWQLMFSDEKGQNSKEVGGLKPGFRYWVILTIPVGADWATHLYLTLWTHSVLSLWCLMVHSPVASLGPVGLHIQNPTYQDLATQKHFLVIFSYKLEVKDLKVLCSVIPWCVLFYWVIWNTAVLDKFRILIK